MSSKQIKDIEYHYSISVAAIDYLISKDAQTIIYEDYSPVLEYYENKKNQLKIYLQKRQLSKIEQVFNLISIRRQRELDFNFNIYIKDKTGHNIDIFENLIYRANIIIEQNYINSKEEEFDIVAAIDFYRKKNNDKSKIEILHQLLVNYSQPKINTLAKSRNSSKSNIKNSLPNTERKRVEIKSRLNPNVISEIYSPNCKHKLVVAKSSKDINRALTFVAVHFENASVSIFTVRGINLNIKAYWDDDNTITIESEKECEVIEKFNTVQSFSNIFKIKYIKV
jgi:hypothetical protein